MSLRDLHPVALLLVFLGLVFGLTASFRFRRKPWIVFIWLPTILPFAYGTYLVLRRLSAVRQVDGPESGFAAMEAIFLVPVLGLCIVGFLACYFCRPRKEAWRLSTSVPAIIIYAALLIFSDRQNGSNVEIQLFNIAGQPLSGVRVQHNLTEGGLSMQSRLLSSDENGRVSFRVRSKQSVTLRIMPIPSSPQAVDTSPTFWQLGINALENTPEKLVVRHSWERSVANQTLNESVTEIIARTRDIHISLTLPPHASLDPSPRRERIRAALSAFQESMPPGFNYAFVCRNVEAIEFIPLLIDTYRQKAKERGAVIEGLSQIAAILSDLERACLEVQRRIKSESSYPRQMLQNQVAQFCIWAGISDDSRSDVPGALEQVQSKIAGHAKLLTDFAFEEMPRDEGVLKVLSELRRLARPTLPRVIAALVNDPPKNMQTASHWDHPLSMMGARFADLEPLFNSQNPLLVILASDATPNEELQNAIAAKVLARLEEVRPQVSDKVAGQRADHLIEMLRARLK